LLFGNLQGFFTVGRRDYFVAGTPKGTRHEQPYSFFVICNEHAWRCLQWLRPEMIAMRARERGSAVVGPRAQDLCRVAARTLDLRIAKPIAT